MAIAAVGDGWGNDTAEASRRSRKEDWPLYPLLHRALHGDAASGWCATGAASTRARRRCSTSCRRALSRRHRNPAPPFTASRAATDSCAEGSTYTGEPGSDGLRFNGARLHAAPQPVRDRDAGDVAGRNSGPASRIAATPAPPPHRKRKPTTRAAVVARPVLNRRALEAGWARFCSRLSTGGSVPGKPSVEAFSVSNPSSCSGSCRRSAARAPRAGRSGRAPRRCRCTSWGRGRRARTCR